MPWEGYLLASLALWIRTSRKIQATQSHFLLCILGMFTTKSLAELVFFGCNIFPLQKTWPLRRNAIGAGGIPKITNHTSLHISRDDSWPQTLHVCESMLSSAEKKHGRAGGKVVCWTLESPVATVLALKRNHRNLSIEMVFLKHSHITERCIWTNDLPKKTRREDDWNGNSLPARNGSANDGCLVLFGERPPEWGRKANGQQNTRQMLQKTTRFWKMADSSFGKMSWFCMVDILVDPSGQIISIKLMSLA